MRPLIDNLDELDVIHSARARRLYEKQRRKETRFGDGLLKGPKHKRCDEDYDDYKDYDEYVDYEDYEEYDEDEFDSHARIHHPY